MQNRLNKKISSLSFTFMLVISVVAFAFIIGSETRTVSAAGVSDPVDIDGKKYYIYTDANGGETLMVDANWWQKILRKQIDGKDLMPYDTTKEESYNTLLYTAKEKLTKQAGDNYLANKVYYWNNGENYFKGNEGDFIEASKSNNDILVIQESEYIKNLDSVDSDRDGLSDFEEELLGTDINNKDSDGDGYLDEDELVLDLDPLDKNSNLDKEAGITGPSDLPDPTGTPETKGKTSAVIPPKQVTGDALARLTGPDGLLSAHAGKDIYQAADGAYLLKNADNTFSQISRGGVKTTLFGTMDNFFAGHLVEGLTWSIGVFGVVSAIAPMMGKEQSQIDALNMAAFAGIMSGKVWYGLTGKGGVNLGRKVGAIGRNSDGTLNWFGRNAGSKYASMAVGAGVAWLVYNSQYEKTKTRNETVTFECLPWQAPNGGADCELCNDGELPCSEYRCKSLGQSCSIINKGTIEEMCVNTNPYDVSPPTIKPLESALTEGFAYTDVKDMPPGAGFKIKNTGTTLGCIPPFTPIEFGITTDEPSQCKIDVEPQGNYSKMTTYFGGSNLYSYNHTESLSLPAVSDIKNSSLNLQNGKELSFFIRCKDANGKTNEADYELKLCVDPSPDTMAPQIVGTSIQTGGCVASNTENASVDFYLNEPAECKWSFTDSSFDQMKYNMSCATSFTQINALQVYTCSALLTGVARDGTNFFVRCKDQPVGVNESKRNPNQDSYQFSLRGSNPLKLKNIKPNSTVYGAVRPAPIELYAETLFGCDSNKAICYYSTTGANNSFVQFYDTNTADGIHTQRLDLYDGIHNYFVRCVDSGGNLVEEKTTFKLDIDPNAPIIARVYEDVDYLKIITPYPSECVFTNDNCDFLFDEGTIMHYANSETHVTPWLEDKTYYIKCRDEYRSEPTDCSMIVRPTENFL